MQPHTVRTLHTSNRVRNYRAVGISAAERQADRALHNLRPRGRPPIPGGLAWQRRQNALEQVRRERTGAPPVGSTSSSSPPLPASSDISQTSQRETTLSSSPPPPQPTQPAASSSHPRTRRREIDAPERLRREIDHTLPQECQDAILQSKVDWSVHWGLITEPLVGTDSSSEMWGNLRNTDESSDGDEAARYSRPECRISYHRDGSEVRNSEVEPAGDETK